MQATRDDEHEKSAKYDGEIQFLNINYVHMMVTKNYQVSAIPTWRIHMFLNLEECLIIESMVSHDLYSQRSPHIYSVLKQNVDIDKDKYKKA